MSLFSTHTKIKVDPQLLLDTAAGIEEHAGTVGDIYDQLNNMFWGMGADGQWEGSAFQATLDATSKNAEKFAPVAEELEELAAFLRNVANTMSEADTEVSNSIKAI